MLKGVFKVALTFDDGLPEHCTVAEHLHSLGIKASFLVPVKAVDKSLSEGCLARITKLGHELVSHSVTHRSLTSISESEVIFELKYSKEVLETYQREVRGFGYPFGAYNIGTIRLVAKFYEYARSYNTSGDLANHPLKDVYTPYALGAIDISVIGSFPYIHNKKSPLVLIKALRGEPLILMIHKCSIRSVDMIVRALGSLGYRFVRLSDIYELVFPHE